MNATVTELPDSRVRVEATIEPDEVERRLERAAKALGRELRIPGFRKGKVPPTIVLQRLGRGAVLEQALRDSLGEWYERAVRETGVKPIGSPVVDFGDVPEASDQPLSVSFEVAVQPKANLGDYKGLEVGRHEPQVPDEAVEAEIERMREGFASLETVERAAGEGDLALIDFRGTVDGVAFEGGEASDYLVELGAGRLVEGFEAELIGAEAGQDLEVEVTFPDDYGAEELAGKHAVFAVKLKEVREKRLPELSDDFAAEASEFDTLDELRADIAHKLRHAIEHRVEDEFRRAAIDAAVEKAKVDVPDHIVTARAEETWERLAHSLAHQGVTEEQYLQISGKTREEAIEEAKPSAEQVVKREAVLAAIADAEGIEVADEDLLEALTASAEREGMTPGQLLEKLKSSGRDAVLRDELRIRKAVDTVAESAKPIPIEQAEVREKIWTPEKEEEKAAPGLWTPGS